MGIRQGIRVFVFVDGLFQVLCSVQVVRVVSGVCALIYIFALLVVDEPEAAGSRRYISAG